MHLYQALKNKEQKVIKKQSTCRFLFNKTGEIIKKSVSLSLQKNILLTQKNLQVKLIKPFKFKQPNKQQILFHNKHGNKIKMSHIKQKAMGSYNNQNRNQWFQTSPIKQQLQNFSQNKIITNKINNYHLPKKGIIQQLQLKISQLTNFVQKQQQYIKIIPTPINIKNISHQSTNASQHLRIFSQITPYQHKQLQLFDPKQPPDWLGKIRRQKSFARNSLLPGPNQDKIINQKPSIDRCQIAQINSIMTNTICHNSMFSNQNIILDESLVDWTYETGFKTEPNQCRQQQF